MKTLRIERDFYYRPNPRAVMFYKGGQQYDRVPEAAVAAILKAKAGAVVNQETGLGESNA